MTTEVLERPMTPEEFRAMNEHTYGERNRELYSTDALILRLLEQSQLFAKVARKDYRDDFRIHLADVFSWYNALVNRLGLDVQKIMWYRFPYVCSYCIKNKNCQCQINHPRKPRNKATRLRALRLRRDGREPLTLVEHQALHARLYSWQHKFQPPLAIATHIGEEIAEVSEALRHNLTEEACEEMADVLSWIFAFATRVDLDLSDVMWYFYPYICRKCKKERCVCVKMV